MSKVKVKAILTEDCLDSEANVRFTNKNLIVVERFASRQSKVANGTKSLYIKREYYADSPENKLIAYRFITGKKSTLESK